MKFDNKVKFAFTAGIVVLIIAIVLGAFAAHGLKGKLNSDSLCGIILSLQILLKQRLSLMQR